MSAFEQSAQVTERIENGAQGCSDLMPEKAIPSALQRFDLERKNR
ncbi:hypothetical protein CP97_11595 [Aurantiacibacter atlanticus]|uniref:Uncharacterized protein n=1 Tax=Aurantiacibacter atlanticus TaxID=1648404 RepID=A0A0H4VZA6_9SPHN|nr:hypothetical protein CP97_11595 [Aurantiacibacter atlanticus]